MNTSSPPDPTSAKLSYCTSSAANFYVVNSASQTPSVFNSIGTSLAKLLIAQ